MIFKMAKKQFIRADAHKKKRVGTAWRKPKGLQNKMRLRKKGYSISVKVGYRSEAKHRDLFNGLEVVLVHNKNQLLALNPKTQCCSLAKMGRANKVALIKLAHEKKITLVNLSDKAYVEKTNALQAQRESKKKELLAKQAQKEAAAKDKKKDEAKEAKKSEDASAEEVSADEKKALEKKEKDKILTSKKEQF